MRKKLIELGLAGILALSSQNLNAWETNEKGFPIPDKTDYRLVDIEFLIDMEKDTVTVDEGYISNDQTKAFLKKLVNDKPWMYFIAPKIAKNGGNIEDTYVLEDKDCDGKFETKYSYKEAEDLDSKGEIVLPGCYLK